jgi:alpha-glucan, water dikinase
MTTNQTITTVKGLKLAAQICRREAEVVLTLQAEITSRLLLHWGLRLCRGEGWNLPPQTAWPPETVPVGQGAAQTPFPKANGQTSVVIHLNPAADYSALEFALFFPDEGRWDNNNGRNYQVLLAEPPAAPLTPTAVLRAAISGEELVRESIFDLAGGRQLAAVVTRVGDRYRVRCVCDHGERLILHWGIARRSPHEWLLPTENCRGPKTVIYQERAAETAFSRLNGFNVVQLEFPEQDAPLGIQFVLRDGANAGNWINYRGGNFYVAVRGRESGTAAPGAARHSDVAEEIIRAETTHNSWTLMHRFNLCHDLLDRVRGSLDGLALLYVYLRFSAIRQLTWQRNYNTKPRELAHAQERLTQKVTEIYRSEPGSRPLARLTLATVGRGGEGQRIRDEVLNIMHRHHIKEVSGHFLEEWHQKLHNNTTPDDMVICEAYLAFLRSDGNLDSYYRTLEAGGVTRQRLQSFERPIRSHPDFVPHLKEGLIHDFQYFLRILKASHSGTDLETAINTARGQVDGSLQGVLNYLWEHRNDQGDPVLNLVRQITDARRRLSSLFSGGSGLRELLYLDLALEQLLRAVVERNIHLPLGGDPLVDLIGCVLENVTLSYEEPELAACSRHWERLRSIPRFGAVWSVHAKSVLDRVARALSGWIDRFYQLLQPKAELLGQGFHAEPWTITLFSEEVVRGSSVGFVLSTLLRHLDPLLRQAAHIGNWQIISRGRGAGQVEVVEALQAIQGKRFDTSRVVIADKVTGEEEIPEGVTAVIAPDVVDIVSHVAVRARNAHVLFASCHDAELFQKLKSLRGRHVRLEVSPGGDVTAVESADETPAQTPKAGARRMAVATRTFTKYAIPLSEFDEKLVGGKSWHQAQLRNRLPELIRQPASVALPFGVFEKVLGLELNRDVAKRYAELVRQTAEGGTGRLAALRQAVLSLSPPEELKSALREVMADAGLAWPDDWEPAWSRIKQVWASKWNERAFLSRQRVGLPHESLFMAVLIQQVVPADYAFVIHTVNPSSGNRDELFAEVVLGLGETLVGNYPGRALSFVSHKATGDQTLLSFPGKSVGLYGEGLIFRSDSNGEDLPGYAGAGLYDSVLLKAPRQVDLDYTHQPLVWDEPFRQNLLAAIARIGLELERVSGSPQDIEGAIAGQDYYVVQTRPQVGLG